MGSSNIMCVLLLLTFMVNTCAQLADPAVIESIREHNASRRTQSRTHSALIYLFVAFGYLCLGTLLAIFMGWLWQPWSYFVKKIKGDDLSEEVLAKWNTAAWEVLVLVLIAIMAAGGIPGWMVLGFLFLIASLCICMVTCISRRQRNRVLAEQVDCEGQPVVDMSKPRDWTQHPTQFGRWQTGCAITMGTLMLAFLLITLIVFYVWDVKEYKLYHLTEGEIVELIPENTAKAIAMMYAWQGFATDVRFGLFAKIATSYCGSKFTKLLSTEEEKRVSIYEPFVKLYDIDMSIYNPEDWKEYESANQWFIRPIKLSARPVNRAKDHPNLGTQIVSPADSRMLIFPNLEDSKIWIKGNRFDYTELLGDSELARPFEGGVMVIARLAPQDYHRFNTPVDGTISHVSSIDGAYWSVNPDAVTSGNHAFLNLRKVIMIDTEHMGKVAYVAIGATCVGSVVLGEQIKPGHKVLLKDELGFMQFGGSTVILLFEKGQASFHETIVANSAVPVETYMKVNDFIGVPV